ncbi:hypothetical protein ACJX0J_032531, partial [Zea mays]
ASSATHSLFAEQVQKGNRTNTHLNVVGYDEWQILYNMPPYSILDNITSSRYIGVIYTKLSMQSKTKQALRAQVEPVSDDKERKRLHKYIFTTILEYLVV